MGLFGSIVKGVGSALGGIAGGSSKKKAAQLEYQAAQDAINEQRRQYDTTRADYAPYLEAGTGALAQISALLGLGTPGTGSGLPGTSGGTPGIGDGLPGMGGNAAQASALDALRESPLFQSLYRTGEEAVLQNAAATGGLRGGNAQRSLADFGADTFAQVIQRQLANLAGVAGLGSGATDAVSAFGQQSSANIGNLAQQGASARAGGILGNSGSIASGINSALSELAPYIDKIKF